MQPTHLASLITHYRLRLRQQPKADAVPKARFTTQEIGTYAFVFELGSFVAAVLALQSTPAWPDFPDRMTVQLVGKSSLNGVGKGGEGLALKLYGARKVLWRICLPFDWRQRCSRQALSSIPD